MITSDVDYSAASSQAKLEWNSMTGFEKDAWRKQLEKEKDSLKNIKI